VGSPSVRIDGRGIDPETPDSGVNLECRIYWVNGRVVGVPRRGSNAIYRPRFGARGGRA
jgi:hypothetical protein